MIYMFTTTQLVEVIKMPILIEHFASYKGSFVDFIVHHYGGHEKDADWETDMKLPFMQTSDIMFAVSVIPDLVASESVIFSLEYNISPIRRFNPNLCSNYLSEIFQPPRFC